MVGSSGFNAVDGDRTAALFIHTHNSQMADISRGGDKLLQEQPQGLGDNGSRCGG
jgi:hypothetical protein